MAYEKKRKDDGAFKKLKEQLKTGELERLYVFFGEESYLKEYYRGEVEKKTAGSMADFNMINIDGETLTEDALRDAVETLPFGADKKLIVIRDLDLSGASPNMKEAMIDVFSSLPEYICMILYYQALEYKPDKRLNLYKSIEKNGLAVEFVKAGGSELVNWLKRRFAAHDKKISSADCEYLIFLCGSLMTNLITEVDKISAYAKGETVSREDIDAAASRVLDADVFDLTDCIMSGNYKKAISIYRDLMEAKNEPIAVLGALMRQVQRIYAASLALQNGLGEKYIADLYGFRSSYPARLLIDAARRTTVARAAKAVDICANADIELKSSIPDRERVLELAILRMAQVRAS